MSPLRATVPSRQPLWLGLTGLVMVGMAGLLVATLHTEPIDPITYVGAIGFPTAWIVAGAVALSQRPDNRSGVLMLTVGAAGLMPYLHFAEPVTYTFSQLFDALQIAVAVHLTLAFPQGRLTSGVARLVVAGAYLDWLVSDLAWALVTNTVGDACPECPRNLMLIHESETLGRAVGLVTLPLDLVVLGSVVVLLVHRWRAAGPPARRALAPVLWTSGATAVLLVGFLLAGNLAAASWLDDLLVWCSTIAACTIPVAFLVGLLRVRLNRGVIADLLVELDTAAGPEHTRAALARALGDPSLELAFWLPDQGHYAGPDGALVSDPRQATDRAHTILASDRDGTPVAAITYDPALLDDPTLVAATAAAARLALENSRLHAELRSQLVEVRTIRDQLVRVGAAERSRLERDLHDGAQQRLLGIRLALRLARARLGGQADLVEFMDTTDAEVAAAMDELRALGRGVPRPRLEHGGLRAAVLSVAARIGVPVQVNVGEERLPAALETAAYFIVCEALVNVERHAHATAARVEVTRAGGRLNVEIFDNGIGYAPQRAVCEGNGLRNLRSRVEALGGVFTVDSEPGAGTRVRADIPCA
jgi:signal transduction histidine kinase